MGFGVVDAGMAADTMVMLDLLHEAGDEAVTLDELGIAGVADPARALLELELSGLEIQRVLVRDDREDRAFECVRLAPPELEQPTVELAAVTPRPRGAEPAAAERPSRLPGLLLLGLVLGLLALLLALVALVARRA